MGDNQPSEGGRKHQKQQPGNAALDQLEDAAAEIRLVRGQNGGHHFHILGGLVFHDVHGVVKGDDAHHTPLLIHHGKGEEIILGEHLGDLFLVVMSVDGDDILLHELGNGGFIVTAEQEIFHGDHADEPPIPGDIAGINGLLVHAGAANAQNGFAHIHIRPEGDILGGHPGACAVLGIAQNFIDLLAHIGSSLGEDPLDHIGRHFLHNVHGVVHKQLIEHLFELRIGKTADQQLLLLGIHLHKGLRRQFLGEQAEHQRKPLLVKLIEKGGQVRGVHGVENIPQGMIFFLLQQTRNGLLNKRARISQMSTPSLFFLYNSSIPNMVCQSMREKNQIASVLDLIFSHFAGIIPPYPSWRRIEAVITSSTRNQVCILEV